MGNNIKQKAKDFFRKEGFYVVLFICLCIMATVATIAYKKLNDTSTKTNIQDSNNTKVSLDVNDKSKEVSGEIPNADKVENSEQKVVKNENKESASQQVMANASNLKFVNPVDGKLLRDFNLNPQKYGEDTLRTVFGIDISAPVGTNVKAAADGVVQEAKNSGPNYGVVVSIKHSNGLITKYCNLSEELSVKAGDKVTAGTVIGKVGNTSGLYKNEDVGEHLTLQVVDSNAKTDKDAQKNPTNYFSYTK